MYVGGFPCDNWEMDYGSFCAPHNVTPHNVRCLPAANITLDFTSGTKVHTAKICSGALGIRLFFISSVQIMVILFVRLCVKSSIQLTIMRSRPLVLCITCNFPVTFQIALFPMIMDVVII